MVDRFETWTAHGPLVWPHFGPVKLPARRFAPLGALMWFHGHGSRSVHQGSHLGLLLPAGDSSFESVSFRVTTLFSSRPPTPVDS